MTDRIARVGLTRCAQKFKEFALELYEKDVRILDDRKSFSGDFCFSSKKFDTKVEMSLNKTWSLLCFTFTTTNVENKGEITKTIFVDKNMRMYADDSSDTIIDIHIGDYYKHKIPKKLYHVRFFKFMDTLINAVANVC